ncbi:3'3'-cGAMP-specific phosphodiesterase 3 (3'3'-cGAMP PDE 3) (V-cGAP3) [Durusdinium trenchii]|uniref:3'3'-cGAMP-specific phosphodiesterase 3 (3'3'-cGAMP PDE 3) (V-cGAP3) n=1 Tax=Durusdinium trenchii TaxID=1381693 RepID=A0ABP0LN05_9DINO
MLEAQDVEIARPYAEFAADEAYLDDIAVAFGLVIDAKSSFTSGHSTRVALYTDLIAIELGLSERRRRWLWRCALLHDVGKLGVSNAILDKPGKLNDEEWTIMRDHARHSENILSRIPVFEEISAVASAHHERLDGKGYPNGLAGDEVTLEMRIISVADIFDALTAARPYRPAMDVETALSTIEREVGNGGYSAGLFAQLIDGPAAVMLKSPPPLDTPIKLRASERGGSEAVHGDRVIAVASPAEIVIDPPALPSNDDIAVAHDCFLDDADGEHLLPYCFVCGNKRSKEDGLRLFTGPAPDSPVNADFWTPAADLGGEDGLVKPEFLWAALDCPSAFALRNGLKLALLGRLAVDIRRRPKPGEKLIITAWKTGQEGRKYFSSSALYDESREIIAAANAVWVELNDPAFLAKLKAENA